MEKEMATKVIKTIPKISVKIWKPILVKLDQKLDAACLRRDAYLAKLLEAELPHLDREVSIENSQASYNYVASQLDKFDRKPVSLALPPELTTRLNEICAAKRIVRDAFFNRLFLLLAASRESIDKLLFNDYDGNWRTDVWSEWKHEGPFFQNGFYPLEADIDPFWAVREGLKLYNRGTGTTTEIAPDSRASMGVDSYFGHVSSADSLYSRVFTSDMGEHNLIALSCSLPDWQVPGHKEETQLRRTLDELLGL